jgi:hypothetical protein
MTTDPILNAGGRREATAEDIDAATGVLWRVWGGGFPDHPHPRGHLRLARSGSLATVRPTAWAWVRNEDNLQ